MNYNQHEIEMARKGYVYAKNSNAGNGMRKRVKVLTNEKRDDLIFDVYAYADHGHAD
jgi:hypothetical protein